MLPLALRAIARAPLQGTRNRALTNVRASNAAAKIGTRSGSPRAISNASSLGPTQSKIVSASPASNFDVRPTIQSFGKVVGSVATSQGPLMKQLVQKRSFVLSPHTRSQHPRLKTYTIIVYHERDPELPVESFRKVLENNCFFGLYPNEFPPFVHRQLHHSGLWTTWIEVHILPICFEWLQIWAPKYFPGAEVCEAPLSELLSEQTNESQQGRKDMVTPREMSYRFSFGRYQIHMPEATIVEEFHSIAGELQIDALLLKRQMFDVCHGPQAYYGVGVRKDAESGGGYCIEVRAPRFVAEWLLRRARELASEAMFHECGEKEEPEPEGVKGSPSVLKTIDSSKSTTQDKGKETSPTLLAESAEPAVSGKFPFSFVLDDPAKQLIHDEDTSSSTLMTTPASHHAPIKRANTDNVIHDNDPAELKLTHTATLETATEKATMEIDSNTIGGSETKVLEAAKDLLAYMTSKGYAGKVSLETVIEMAKAMVDK